MIEKNNEVDDLITKLLAKFKVEGSNIERKSAQFMQEALLLKKQAPFLNSNSYLYFLSEMSVVLIQLNDGSYAAFYGVDDWDEGMNILDYPIPEENGFHMFMDLCSPEGEILYFAYNSKSDGKDEVWTAPSIEGLVGTYTKTDMTFVDVLNLKLIKS